MTRLTPIRPDDLLRLLTSLGFEIQRQSGSHVHLSHADGRVTIVPIHGGREIGPGLLRHILREINLGRDEFLRLLHNR